MPVRSMPAQIGIGFNTEDIALPLESLIPRVGIVRKRRIGHRRSPSSGTLPPARSPLRVNRRLSHSHAVIARDQIHNFIEDLARCPQLLVRVNCRDISLGSL